MIWSDELYIETQFIMLRSDELYIEIQSIMIWSDELYIEIQCIMIWSDELYIEIQSGMRSNDANYNMMTGKIQVGEDWCTEIAQLSGNLSKYFHILIFMRKIK